MAMKKLFNLLMFIFVVSLVIEKERMVKVVEAGDFCWRPSQLFHGLCLLSGKCNELCKQEGFVVGECKGLIDRQCMCGGDCSGGNPPPGPPGEDPQPPPPPEEDPQPPPGEEPPQPPPEEAAAAKLRQNNITLS